MTNSITPSLLCRATLIALLTGTASLCLLWSTSPLLTWPSTSTLMWLAIPSTLAAILALATRRTRALSLLAALSLGLMLAIARTSCAIPEHLPPHIASPHTLTASVEVLTHPTPTPQGWRVEVRDTSTPRTFVASLPAELLDDPHAPPLPGEHLLATLSLSPTPAKNFPDELHPRVRLARAHLHAYARITDISPTKSAPRSLSTHLATLRLSLIKTLRLSLPHDDAALVLAMTLGSKHLLPEHLREPFAVTGTAHLLAISGLHLGTLAALLALLLRFALATLAPRALSRHGVRRLAHPVMACVLIGYVTCIGAPTSAMRSLIMILLVFLIHASSRRIHPTQTLLCALGLLCLIDPMYTLEPAFWLSASATYAILSVIATTHTQTRHHASRLMKVVRDGARVSAAAWLGTAPVVLSLTHELPLVGVPMNMLLVPLVGLLIFPVMVFGLLLLPLAPALAIYPLMASTTALKWCAALCEWAAASPGASWRPGELPLWLVLILSALVLATLRDRVARPRRALMWLGSMLLCTSLYGAQRDLRAADSLRVDFIPVGQGDATLITFPDGETMLIDAGGSHLGRDPGSTYVLPWLRRRGISHVDTLVLTHADVDHMRGMFAITRRATPRAFIAAHDREVHELTRLRDTLDARRVISLTALKNLHTIDHGDTRVTLHALHDPSLTRNDRSIVIELHHKGATILLPGDIEHAAETQLLEKLSSPVTLIKMPHHGSHSSSSAALLDHITPAIAIASCGLHNRFDHPRPNVLARYAERGTRVWRTDHHGVITATISDQGTLTIAHPIQLP